MVEITPKALRFARLAAEYQPGFSGDAQIDCIRREEAAFSRLPLEARLQRQIEISDKTAAFCIRAVDALLADRQVFSTDEWDGNDYEFLRALVDALQHQLSSVSQA